MKLEDFNSEYLTTRVIFDIDAILPGQAIKVYRCDCLSKEGVFQHSGIIEEVDKLRIKYVYYQPLQGIVTGYIHATDIPEGMDDSRWEEDEPYNIFKVME